MREGQCRCGHDASSHHTESDNYAYWTWCEGYGDCMCDKFRRAQGPVVITDNDAVDWVRHIG